MFNIDTTFYNATDRQREAVFLKMCEWGHDRPNSQPQAKRRGAQRQEAQTQAPGDWGDLQDGLQIAQTRGKGSSPPSPASLFTVPKLNSAQKYVGRRRKE